MVLLIISVNMFAQHKVTIRIKTLPFYHNPSDPVYIAGSFNNWNPSEKESQLERVGNGTYMISTVAPAGKYEYKFTRGSWEKVEAGQNGTNINNRVLEINRDTTIEISILHWADHFSKKEKKSTASKNVKIIETNFSIPQLNRKRRVWIYLPEDYNESKAKYPVIYMHDGQNIFEDSTSFSGEWGVDEALDTMGVKYGKSIIVAIDNGGEKRMNEYAPFDMQRFGKGEGDQYINFLVKTLMPYINKNYRTLRSGKNNSIVGSSMGGLISLFAILKYPKKFGNAGVFSPAFWVAPAMKDVVAKRGKNVKGKIYFFAGQQESESMVPDMLSIMQQMTKFRKATITTVIRAEGKHNEATWRQEFPVFYGWIMKGQMGK
jgi:predicted alpha/beta superfamily hydrolase